MFAIVIMTLYANEGKAMTNQLTDE